MIRKGYHYAVSCDSEKCGEGFIIGVNRHGIKERIKSKQEVIRRGWFPAESGTTFCKKCVAKIDKQVAADIAKEIEKDDAKVA